MAPKAGPKKKTRNADEPRLAERVADAALAIAARDGWGAVNPEQIAVETGEPLGMVIGRYPAPSSVLTLLMRRIDASVLSAVTGIDTSESPRDRLFEVLMMRLDVLQASRDGYVSILQSMRRCPGQVLFAAPSSLHSMALMLIAAGVGTSGPLGAARVQALALSYGSVLGVWLKDETVDLGPTMAALDEALQRLENIASMPFVRGLSGVRKKNMAQGEESP